MTRPRRLLLLSLVAILAGGTLVSGAYLEYGRGTNSGTPSLPPGCVKPPGGFLIVASFNGFNDSVDHGVPAANWPLVEVRMGANVTIRVCNADNQPHGFQIAHYYESHIEAVAPGQVLTLSFIADQAGFFKIYCSILCTVHWAMISGQLSVG